jgi:hypothetical protein
MWDFRSHICDYEEYCHVFMCVTMNGVRIRELDLLTTCTHRTELQVIAALFLISTLYKSLYDTSLLACSVSNSCSLATASKSKGTPRKLATAWILQLCCGCQSPWCALGLTVITNPSFYRLIYIFMHTYINFIFYYILILCIKSTYSVMETLCRELRNMTYILWSFFVQKFPCPREYYII